MDIPLTIRQLSRAYTTRNNAIAFANIAVTLALYLAALIGAIVFAHLWWVVVPGVVLTGACAVRLFMLQHDCGHGSFFTTRAMNDRAGFWLSPFTLTPYRAARYNHNLHHTHIGDLDERDASEIYTMTVAEYAAAPLWRRLAYRLYRSPLTLFLVGPTLLYLLRYRAPKSGIRTGVWDVIWHDVLIAVFVGGLIWAFGWTALWVWVASVAVGTSFGAVIPYVQHNFETVYWKRAGEREFEAAALEGSAVLDFGWLFDLATANIAYHDLHHLNSNIPSYHLRRCHTDLADKLGSTRIGLLEAARCFRWKLWDEGQGRMVPFPPLITEAKATRLA